METRIAYCSACDQDVRIVITDEPSQDGHANLHDSEIVCLEIGHQCTGALCPVGATAPVVMAARLVRNGLQSKLHPIVTMACSTCGEPRSFVILDEFKATCSDCGTTIDRAARQWSA